MVNEESSFWGKVGKAWQYEVAVLAVVIMVLTIIHRLNALGVPLFWSIAVPLIGGVVLLVVLFVLICQRDFARRRAEENAKELKTVLEGIGGLRTRTEKIEDTLREMQRDHRKRVLESIESASADEAEKNEVKDRLANPVKFWDDKIFEATAREVMGGELDRLRTSIDGKQERFELDIKHVLGEAANAHKYLRHDLHTSFMMLVDRSTALESFIRELWEFDNACTKCIRLNNALPEAISLLVPAHNKLRQKIDALRKETDALWKATQDQLDELEPGRSRVADPLSVRLNKQTE